MDYLTLKIVHSAAGVLLLLGVIAHLLMLVKASKQPDPLLLARKLNNTRRFSVPALALVGVSLPVTGWWLVHTVGWPLSQLWLLLSAVLMAVLIILAAVLAARLNSWAQGNISAAKHSGYCALAIVIVLIAIFALMGAKPA